MTELTRFCTLCSQKFLKTEAKPGSGHCPACRKAKDREYYQNDKQKWKDREKKARAEDLEKIRKKNRESASRHRTNPHNTIDERRLKKKFGITLDQFHAMIDHQDNKCAICGNGPVGRARKGGAVRLHIDHCHATGKVRGLLCYKCNTGLGVFEDNPKYLAEAIRYLEWTSRGDHPALVED